MINFIKYNRVAAWIIVCGFLLGDIAGSADSYEGRNLFSAAIWKSTLRKVSPEYPEPIRHKKGGPLRPEEARYKEKLVELLEESFSKSADKVSEKEMIDYSEIIANTLVRYDIESINSLAVRGILTDAEASSILDKRDFEVIKLVDRVISILAGYRRANITKVQQKKLLANFFTIEEIEFLKSLFAVMTDGNILHACIHNPKSPRDFLRGVIKARDKISSEGEFKNIPGGIILHACIYHPKSPRDFLKGAIKTRDKISSEEEFNDVSDKSILYAAIHHSKSPRDFLRSVIKIRNEIRKEKEFNDMPNSIILRACTSNSANPRHFLRGVIETKNKMRKEKEFKDMPDWAILHVCIGNSTNPRSFLKSAIAIRNIIRKEKEFNDASDKSILYAAIHNPKAPREYLRAHKLGKSGFESPSENHTRALSESI